MISVTGMSDGALAGRVIVIVGGTSGLGLSAAKACIAAGAKVVAVGRIKETVASARQMLGANAGVFAGDATNPATAQEAIARAIEAVQPGKVEFVPATATLSNRAL